MGVVGEKFGGSGSIAVSGDGLVLAAGVSGRGANGEGSGGVRGFRESWGAVGVDGQCN